MDRRRTVGAALRRSTVQERMRIPEDGNADTRARLARRIAAVLWRSGGYRARRKRLWRRARCTGPRFAAHILYPFLWDGRPHTQAGREVGTPSILPDRRPWTTTGSCGRARRWTASPEQPARSIGQTRWPCSLGLSLPLMRARLPFQGRGLLGDKRAARLVPGKAHPDPCLDAHGDSWYGVVDTRRSRALRVT